MKRARIVEPGTIEEACAVIGGKGRPINRASYYRGVKDGRYPAPVRVSPGISRVDLARVREIVAAIMRTEAAE